MIIISEIHGLILEFFSVPNTVQNLIVSSSLNVSFLVTGISSQDFQVFISQSFNSEVLLLINFIAVPDFLIKGGNVTPEGS